MAGLLSLPRRLALPAGLRLSPANSKSAAVATGLAMLGAGALVLALDLAFRTALPPDYVQFYTGPLWPRLVFSCLGAIREELLYRLVLTTAFAALPAMWGKRAGPRWMIFAIAAAQLVNVEWLVFEAAPWGALRFWLVGCVWGWLYWRHGLVSALLGHGTLHLLLDPLLLAVLAP
jgi:Type II CAAX prenyl endopeptidase Rce1-like